MFKILPVQVRKCFFSFIGIFCSLSDIDVSLIFSIIYLLFSFPSLLSAKQPAYCQFVAFASYGVLQISISSQLLLLTLLNIRMFSIHSFFLSTFKVYLWINSNLLYITIGRENFGKPVFIPCKYSFICKVKLFITRYLSLIT